MPVTVSLSVAAGLVLEAGGTKVVTATLSGTSGGDVTIVLSIGGTATGGGIDYTISGTTIVIPAGQLTGTITITAVDDALYEGDETVIVDIESVVGAEEDGVQTVTITILDDEAAPTPATGYVFGIPCCCHDTSCAVFSDDFQRGDSTDLGANWTEVAGDWEIVSNELFTADAGAQVISTVDAADENIKLRCILEAGTDGRIILDWLDADNYHFAEFTAEDTVEIYSRAGGADNLLASKTMPDVDVPMDIEACISGGVMRAWVRGTKYHLAAAITAHGGTRYGLATASGTATFDSVVVARVGFDGQQGCEECGILCIDCCPELLACCDAIVCCDGVINRCCGLVDHTDSYDVDLGAGGWTAEGCSYCPSVSGIFTLTLTDGCWWQYTATAVCLNENELCGFPCGPTDGWDLELTLARVASAGSCYWKLLVELRMHTCGGNCGYSSVEYRSATGPWNEPCDLASPLTLTKHTEGHFGPNQSPCTGTMPATITLASSP